MTAPVDDVEGQAEIDNVVETELVDVDGDWVVDVEREVTTTVVDVDGDGVPDFVEQTTTTAYDLDGDGVADIIETTTVTGIDANRDGRIDESEISIEAAVAVREDLLGDAPELRSVPTGSEQRNVAGIAIGAAVVLVLVAVVRRRLRHRR